MIVDLPNTTTNDINKKITGLREEGGAITLSRVLTLVISLHSDELLEDAIEAANFASREHPCRVIVVVAAIGMRRNRAGRPDCASAVTPVRARSSCCVCTANSPTTPAVWCCRSCCPTPRWWRGGPPEAPMSRREDPVGQLAIRRITNATDCADPLAAIKGRLAGYTAGDTDLAWSRITYWRALLASALDQPPFEPVTSAVVSGFADEPSLDVLAGWLAARIDGPVQRAVGELKVELIRAARPSPCERPQTGVTATISRTAKPDR